MQYCSSCQTALSQHTPSGQPAAVEMSPRPTEHVQSEGRGQGDPMYEDILPHTKDEGAAIELEQNIAYSTTIDKARV